MSGGLDSTQALLVACRAFDRMDLARTGILGFTMPGFATSEGTKSNAWALMKALGITGAEIDIRPAAERMLKDIGHPYAAGQPVHDITFENVQAGLRTDYLFRLANQHGGLVLGTGDLSELALGWATYGVGDHMSHYNVNGGVAKTLIRHLIRWVAAREHEGAAGNVLQAILGTEISPELVPAKDGQIQSTEATVGPYALNDFFLFYITRFGLKPSKVAYLAHQAWKDAATGHWPVNTPDDEKVEYDLATIKSWLRKFLIRWVAAREHEGAAGEVLQAILDTEISPELVPAKDGQIQSTEATVGPYALNDFFLFYITRFGLKPSKVAYLARQAWKDAATGRWPAHTPDDEKVEYDLATIKGWLRKFLVRFFQTSQFKRSALPNGPKVVTGGSLSPRGDWRAPSDATARVWLDELDASVPD